MAAGEVRRCAAHLKGLRVDGVHLVRAVAVRAVQLGAAAQALQDRRPPARRHALVGVHLAERPQQTRPQPRMHVASVLLLLSNGRHFSLSTAV